jgi:prepilin-type N-terminal cleavage/methylation domain-containing protein
MSDRTPIELPDRRRGFTLIEILVIITILGLLIGIAVPAGIMFRRQAARKASLARIALLSGACEMYRSDFDFYPPSDALFHGNLPNPATNEERWTGGQLLCLLLTGYAPDLDSSGAPTPDGRLNLDAYGTPDLSVDDGKESFGFRIAPKGRVYGPYNGAEGLPAQRFRLDDSSPEKPPAFLDTFGQPICYYRYDTSADQYDSNHNLVNLPVYYGSEDVMQYARNSAGRLYRRDFILCSMGPNDTWYEPWRDGDEDGRDDDNDDITNFVE